MTNCKNGENNPANSEKSDGWRWALECARDDAFLLSDLLSEIEDPSATAVAIDGVDRDIFHVQAYYLEKPDLEKLTNVISGTGLIPPEITQNAKLAPVESINWVARSQKNLAPVEAGRFIVHGSHDREKMRGNPFAIEIDAGEAFGTAHHGTTRGCLKALDALLRLKTPGHILDLGTGTGVLAIAAAKGCQNAKIIATDIDPVATRVAKTNCNLNNVGNQFEILTCAGFNHPTLRRTRHFDLIIANILADPLKRLSPQFREHLAPDAIVILSGILNTQAKSVRATFRAQGFIDCAQIEDGEWSILTIELSG